VIQIGKEEVKLSLFADDLTSYLKYPKDSARTFLDVIKEFQKSRIQKPTYKIRHTKTSILFLYTNNALNEKEVRKAILVLTASKRTTTTKNYVKLNQRC
jgi:hypothetical protein